MNANNFAAAHFQMVRDELLLVAEDAITLLTNEDGKELAPLWAKRARVAIARAKP